MGKWGVWGCREEELCLLYLSKTQDILERQGEERDKSWLLNFVHSYGNSRAAVRPRLCHVVTFWAVLVEGQDLSNSHCWLREEVTQQVLSPAAWQSHFGVLHHAHPCSAVGPFSHHWFPLVTFSPYLPLPSTFYHVCDATCILTYLMLLGYMKIFVSGL